MEEFFANYGVKNEHEFFTSVASDSIFAMRVVRDFFYEKFPTAPVEETAPEHVSGEVEENHEDAQDSAQSAQ